MKTPLALLWFFVLLSLSWLWWRAIAWYPSIPDRYPSRFDIDGRPVSWATKSYGTWFLLPTISTALALGLLVFAGLALPRLARSSPGLFNLPHKQRFLALDPDGRVRALFPVRCFLAVVALATTILLTWVLEALARGSTELHGPTLLWPGVFLGFIFIGVAIMSWAMHRTLGRPTAAG